MLPEGFALQNHTHIHTIRIRTRKHANIVQLTSGCGQVLPSKRLWHEEVRCTDLLWTRKQWWGRSRGSKTPVFPSETPNLAIVVKGCVSVAMVTYLPPPCTIGLRC